MTSKLDKNFYDQKLGAALENLHIEGRYRTFIEIERSRGNFPKARWISENKTEKPVTVWCGNDYLGMGQSSIVLEAMQNALKEAGAGSGGTRNIYLGQLSITKNLNMNWPTYIIKKLAYFSQAPMSPMTQLFQLSQSYFQA